MNDWLHIERGEAPLIVSIPHAGTDIPDDIVPSLVSIPLGQHDADLYVDQLYAFARDLGATIIRTSISRTVIDVNRDPSGASLYPGQTTTGLCPTETFDGLPFYKEGQQPDDGEIARRRELYFTPYHMAIASELKRLRSGDERVVLYDAHSIRSIVPRLFDDELPIFNIGTNSGASCDVALAKAVETVCAASGQSHITNGRFKGGWITRHYGRPADGVHAIQMELAMRAYLDESLTWPPPFDPEIAASTQAILGDVLSACLAFAKEA